MTASPPPSPIDGVRCLVTGAAGFVGRHIVDALLARGCAVHALDVLDEPAPRAGVTWFKGDIRDRAVLERCCEGVAVVFHTAALIELAKLAPHTVVERVRSINVGGTRLLLEVAREKGATRFVHTSTMNTVFKRNTAGADERLPYTESRDLYSSTKAEAEKLVLSANGVGGMYTAAVRPGGIYGPGERQVNVGPMVKALKAGQPVVGFGDGSNRIDYSYIDNLVDGHILAAERLLPGSPVGGQAYFITDGTPINPGDFSLRVAKGMGLERKIVRIPRPVCMGMGLAMELMYKVRGRKPEFTRTHVEVATLDSYFSLEKAARDLGYTPKVSLDEGIARTAKEARAYHDSL